ncbi:MAG: HAD family hydrolase, partial [Fimbriimonadaceae bacterium]|nr:HAD family hydrolase [Alphaproteobacteria bacterium]
MLAIAGKAAPKADTQPYADLILFGIVAFQDPPRADVAAAIADARRAGINVIMVTGDHAATAKHISKTVGLAAEGFTTVAGSELKPLPEMSDKEKKQARAAHVFSR